jgi:N-acyl-D-amino-acid deacylase
MKKWMLIVSVVLSSVPLLGATEPPFDLVIANGHVVDGTGSPWYVADVGVRDGRIAAIGRLTDAPAKQRIDARGRVVAPGFIDMLGQSEVSILVDPSLPSKIFQGITTEVTGEGGSIGPVDDKLLATDKIYYEHYGIEPDWHTLGQYFDRIERQGIGINLASYVGATQVRRMVLGDDDVQPTPEQLEKMRALVAEAMQDGAVGLSTALEYAPAPYAKTEELVALAAEAARFGGIYATHMRSEGEAIDAALDETFRIGREAGIPVEIWHLKAGGKPVWGKMPEIVARIDAARAAGIDVAADTYAYTAWYNSMSAFVPPWAHDGGDDKLIARLKDPQTRARIVAEMKTPSTAWDNEWQEISGPDDVLIGAVHDPKLLPIQGKRLSEIAKERGKEPIEVLLDILVEDDAYTGCAVFGMREDDVELALAQPWVSINNDSSGTSPEGILGQEHPHPRAYGTFPRILRKYVREQHLLTLPEAIRKFAALPAQRMRFADRGVIKTGMAADLVVFDPETIRDVATFDDPNRLSVGMEWVLVNGVPVIADGQATKALPGRVLRGPGWSGAASR